MPYNPNEPRDNRGRLHFGRSIPRIASRVTSSSMTARVTCQFTRVMGRCILRIGREGPPSTGGRRDIFTAASVTSVTRTAADRPDPMMKLVGVAFFGLLLAPLPTAAAEGAADFLSRLLATDFDGDCIPRHDNVFYTDGKAEVGDCG